MIRSTAFSRMISRNDSATAEDVSLGSRETVLVHDWLTGMRGGEKCLEAGCRLLPNAELLTLFHRPGAASDVIERRNIQTSFLQQIPGVFSLYRYLLPLIPAAMERLAVPHDAELVLSFSHAAAKSVRVPKGVPHVCYCFTPMRYAWDRRRDYFPLPKRSANTLKDILSRARWAAWSVTGEPLLDRLQEWDRRTAQGVTRFLAASRTVAQRIRRCYGRESHVLYPPVDTEFYRPAPVPREDFLLCVSAIVPYKRIDLAIKACERLGQRLIVIGDGPQRQRLQRMAGDRVRFLGRRSNEEIRDHLRRCKAFLFPGHEDFGIAPVEALACGTPVVAHGQGGVTESVLPADEQTLGCGVFFPEQTAESLATAVRWLQDHSDHIDPSLARNQALRFNAPRFQRELKAHLHAALRDDVPSGNRRRRSPISDAALQSALGE
ncbi:MAG: glycosyltransferase [Planctomycetales bacterium]